MNLTIKNKLLSILVILIAFMIFVGAGGIYTNYKITQSFDALDSSTVPAIQSLDKAKELIVEVEFEALSNTVNSDSNKLKTTLDQLREALASYRKYTVPKESEEIALYEEIASQINFLEGAATRLALTSANGSPEEVASALEDFEAVKIPFLDKIDKAITIEIDEFHARYGSINSLAKLYLELGVLAILFVILLGSVLGIRLYRDIVNPLTKLKQASKRIASGELNEEIILDGHDEMGELANSFNIMAATLKESYDTLEDKVEERTIRLEELSMKNETLLQSIGDGVIAIDAAWNITLWNKASEVLTGWTREEVMGKPFRDFVHFVRERDRSENIIFIQNALLFGQIKFMENHILLIRRDKTEIPVGDSASPIFDSNKKIVGVIIVFRNLSQELNAQAFKTDFKYASHQMRTPITKILWNLESAVDAGSDEERRVFIKGAYESASSISKMSDQFLSVAEIDQNFVIPKYQIASLGEIIADIFSKMQYATKTRNIKFFYNSSAISLETDSKLLSIALFEVIDNGTKYNKDGGSVTVEAKQEDKEIVIEIKDTGIGITEEQQPLVFTKFFRGTNYDTGKIPGAGLGLFISEAYIKIMGGKIWFKSEAGKGTSFFVSLSKARQAA